MISEFNEAKLQIYRLHQMWVTSDFARRAGDLISWKWILDGAEIELAEDAKRLDKSKKREYVKEIKEINEKLNSQVKKKEMYELLKKKMILLKEIQNEAGKGARYKYEDEDSID